MTTLMYVCWYSLLGFVFAMYLFVTYGAIRNAMEERASKRRALGRRMRIRHQATRLRR